MKTRSGTPNNNKSSRFLQRSGCIGALALCLAPFGVRAATEFHPRSEISVGWTDNLLLVGDDDPSKESAYVLQVNPGFTFVEKAKRFRAMLEYTMQNLYFPSNHDRNTTYHQANLAAQGELVQQYFFLAGSGSYSQQIIDPKLPATNSNFFAVANQADALVAQLAPSFRHEYDTFRLDLTYSRGIVKYKTHKATTTGTLLQDADTEVRQGLIGSPTDQQARLSWSGTYDSQIVKYEQTPRFRYDRANVELGLLVGNSLRLIGRGGKESDPTIDSINGGLKQKTWEGGFTWNPSERTQVEGFYGHRFYGKSYSARISHTARLLTFGASYSENPLTQAQQLANQPFGFDPKQLGPYIPGTNEFSRLASDVYLRKAAEANLHVAGQRTQIDFQVLDERREYISATAPGREELRSIATKLKRSLSSRTSFYIGGSGGDTELRDGTQFRDIDLRTGLTRILTEHVNVALNGFHIRRTGNNVGYTANGVSVTLTGEF